MTITQTVEIPANSRSITLEIPREIPSGKTIIAFTPASTAKQDSSAEKNEPLKEREFGCMKGKIWMADDFNAPLEDFKDYM